MNGTSVLNIEDSSRDSFSVHWSAVFAGVFVATLTYIILASLGLAIGANTIRDVIAGDESLRTVGAGGGVWMLASVLISLFLGAYASGRVSGIIATRVGYTQGAVITALFFTLMVSQVGIGLGLLGKSLSGFTSAATSGAVEMVSNTRLNSVVEDVLSNMELRSPVNTVVTGVVTRLVRGDTESAKNYLAAQAGIGPEEAQARLESFRERFKATMIDIGDKSAQAASMLAWSAFITMLLGTIAAMLGGASGAMMNMRRPLSKTDVRFIRKSASAYPA